MTTVKVEFYKPSGRFYSYLEYETLFDIHETINIKLELLQHKQFIPNMNYTIELICDNVCDKYLFLAEKKSKDVKSNLLLIY